MVTEINVCFLDLETTGLEQERGHRIIEMAFLLYSYNLATKERKPLGKYIQRINPNRSIDVKAQAVHKISINDLMGKPLWEDVVDKAVKVLNKTDLLVCHNIGFDGPFIANEIIRVGRCVPQVETFCSMDSGRFATFDGSVPSLRKLSECFGFEYSQSKAHGALYDTLLLSKCFFAGLDGGYFKLPDFKQLEQAA